MSREKRCRRCSETKPAASFRADSRYRDGFGSWCRDCHRSRSGSWAKENRARASAKAQERREQNRDAARAANRKHKRAHRAALAAKHAAWAKANKDKRRVSWARRRAAKVGATPIWADKKMIAAIYRAAVALQTATGQRMHVDHIIPLQHELVCGFKMTVQWWPRSKRIPKGWRLAATAASHHDRYSVLIERIEA